MSSSTTCRIIHATDLHYLAPELTDHGTLFERIVANGDGKVMDYIDEIADAFIETVIKERPDALILSGDLSFNGERQSHETFADKLSAVKQAGIPVYVLPGNHDLYYPLAASYHGDSYTLLGGITAEDFSSIYEACGFSDAIAKDADSLSYIAHLSCGVRLLMLDTNTSDSPGEVKTTTLQWVREQLADARDNGCPIITVSHQTLLTHNRMFRNGFVINNSSDLLSAYVEYGVVANLCGHMHLQHYAKDDSSGLFDLVTSALSITPNQYAVLNLTIDRPVKATVPVPSVQIDYCTVPVDVSSWTDRQDLTDNNLLDFSSYARNFFYDISYRRAYEQLEEEEFSIPETQRSAMAAFVAEVNLGYFTGRMDSVNWDDDLLLAWQQLSSGAMYGFYLQSIEQEKGKNFNTLTFS